MNGSSPLTDDQQTYYLERFGKRYVTVQEQPFRPSRRVRRGRPRDARDLAVYEAQQDAQRVLEKALVRPVVE